MRNKKLVAMVAMMTALLIAAGGSSFAAKDDPKKPGTSTKDINGRSKPAKPASAALAVKREMVRKQQAQRITQGQRKAGANALQTERKKVYDAKQVVAKAKGAGENKSIRD